LISDVNWDLSDVNWDFGIFLKEFLDIAGMNSRNSKNRTKVYKGLF
jgi:hypothetical protein